MPDRLAREVARTRIANTMFGSAEKVKVGRYQLLELVGSGGMGVVWGAWDPELERRVAVKLVNATVLAARNRLLLEGQALAKLSHPNVVPIYDVGVVDDQVYFVMEWVRGENLRSYCKQPRTIREIVALFRTAAEGLRAAHAVGLIHRDFKPDNVMRGDDGRVRVLDFGLARGEVVGLDGDAASVGATRGAGTPRYMPPEQVMGGILTPAVDQFAFCASLREAVTSGTAPGDVPRWIASICARGTSPDPNLRFDSMSELLHALARDPRTVWRRRVLLAGVVFAIAAGFVIGDLHAGSNEIEPCASAAGEVAKTWNDQTRDQLVAHLAGLGPYGAEDAQRITSRLADHSERWAAAHRETCLANARGELTPKLYESRLGCLAQDRAGFETIVDVLSTAPADRLSAAIVAANSLANADRCAMAVSTSAIEPPPVAVAEDAHRLEIAIERARVLALADEPTALAATAAAVTRADQIGYAPLIARAYLTRGLVQSGQDDSQSAIPMLQHAAEVALSANDDATYVEAFARSVFVIGVNRKQAIARGTSTDFVPVIPVAERIATRLGASAGFQRALLFNNIGVALLSGGDRDAARSWFERAVSEPRTQDGEVELVNAFGNLALVVDQPAERDRLLARERTTLEHLLGANHTVTLRARLKEVMFVDNPGVIASELRDVCERLGQYHPHEAVTIGACSFELGWLAEEAGNVAEARPAMMMVAGTTDPSAGLARAYVEMFEGKIAEAAQQASEIADVPQSEWWMRRRNGEAYLMAAICFDKLGERVAAIDRLRSALSIFDDLPMLAHAPYHQRRVARTRALLARLLVGTDRTAAVKLAAAAASWYRAAGGYERQLALLDAITAGFH